MVLGWVHRLFTSRCASRLEIRALHTYAYDRKMCQRLELGSKTRCAKKQVPAGRQFTAICPVVDGVRNYCAHHWVRLVLLGLTCEAIMAWSVQLSSVDRCAEDWHAIAWCAISRSCHSCGIRASRNTLDHDTFRMRLNMATIRDVIHTPADNASCIKPCWL